MKRGQCFDKNHGLTPLQNVDFFDSFRTLLFRSKKHYFLSRRSKNVSFWLCLLKKHISIFWQKPWTNLFGKMSIFSNLLEVQFCGLKSIFFIQDIKKCFFLAFFAQKKHMRKRSIFWQKTWTNPFAKCRFFFTLLELNFSGLKSILFYPEYQKMFLSDVFC